MPSLFVEDVGEWRKQHGLKTKQGPPKSGGDIEGA